MLATRVGFNKKFEKKTDKKMFTYGVENDLNEQRIAKLLRPTNNVAWTTYVVHGWKTYSEPL